MSKKDNSKKKSGGQQLPGKAKLPDLLPENNSLIVFDSKVKVFLLIMIVTYFVISLLKIHTSSVALWSQYFGEKHPKSVIAGTPKGIRQDEWMLSTPGIMGQYQSGFPISNQTFGDGNVPVMFGLPVKDFSMLLRPNVWSYFVFDIERAFAFSWNFSIFFFIISTFILFMVLTRSNFWISIFGTFFIFLSGGMQWWSYWLGTNMINLNGIVLGFLFLLYSKNKNVLIFSGLLMIICAYSFIVSLYPPWQIPLIYLYLAILIGFILWKNDYKTIREKIWLRTSIFSASFLVLLFFIFHYYGLIKETSDIILNTAYPGKRFTSGGDLIGGKLFSEFFGMYMSDTHFPKEWLNICEASGFIMFFPIVFYAIAYNYFKSKKPNWLLFTLSAYVIFLLVWVLIGFPTLLSKASLLSMSPVYRTLPVLGVGNCILLFCFIGNREPLKTGKFSWAELGVLTTAVIIFVWMVCNNINSSTADFFTSQQISTITFLLSAVYLLIRYKHIKYTQPILAVLLLGMTFSNIKIHPLTSGLSAVLENPVVKATEDISRKEPNARWAVFGDQHISNLLKANGINVFNGVKVVPLLKDMAVLDPAGKYNFIYNRYAHINMLYLIDMNDSIQFKLNENNVVNDNYSIFMDPCSPRLKKLGVNYFLFTYKPKEIETRCMTQVKDVFGMYIYKQN